MSKHVQYWTRVVLVGVITTALGMGLDILLGVPYNSARDWLLFFTLLGLGWYFFVFKWAKKTGFWRL